MNRKQIFVHIGTHKTGTTSLQSYLADHRRLLRKHGIDLYSGCHKTTNHVELYLASMRYDRDSFAKQRYRTKFRFDDAYTVRTMKRVQRHLGKSRHSQVLFTTEGLSLLRHDDEIQRLREILDADRHDVTIIVYLRNPADFLRSYRKQLEKSPDRQRSADYWSAMYVEDDTWLIDYDGLLQAYRQGFGDENVQVFDYDVEMEQRGNIIPAFLHVLEMPDVEGTEYFRNRTDKSHRYRIPRFLLNNVKALLGKTIE